MAWDSIIKKCERKLTKWKQKHLSFWGRVTLIKSALNSIPIYFLSFFRIPKKAVDKLVKLQRCFLWGGGVEQKKIAWISWELVCLSKEKGGLGIRDLNKFNCTLLGKWRWNLFNHQEELWARMLDSKYGGRRSLDVERRNSAESVWWKDLRDMCRGSGEDSWFKSRIRWSVGCGSKVRF